MNKLDLTQLLESNPYPGRGIVLGRSADNKFAIAAYFIMGRSENSRNRVFTATEDGIRTEAYDPSKMTDPSLIIYHPVREVGRGLIVTNGDQTDTILEFLERGLPMEQALRTREFEPDGPNWTPRISGLLSPDGSYKLSILKSADPEGSACARLNGLLAVDADESRQAERTVAEIEREQGITYAAQQRQAVALAAREGVLILTGGPGTGKTTTVRGIVALFQKMGLDILLAAPTGRAAKRMSELTGMEAQTVHRMLGMSWNETSHQVTFTKSEKEPLEADAVIVDEMSMVDLSLFSALLRALRPGTRLVLVGDADQLPSVGAGNVFSDLIRSGRVETVFLREVFRQAEQSAIIRNAHAVNMGEPPQLTNNQGDFFFLCRRDAERVVSTVVELCKTRLPDNMGVPSDQIQVLTPTRKGPSGTIRLNQYLQEALNPRAPGKMEIQWGDRLFREGDRIMQTRNDYNVVWEKPDGTIGTGMFNGDVGKIIQIDPSGEWLAVNFEDRIATYGVEMLNEVDLAYAQTVHKAQGSEYRAVVLAAMPAAQSLMVRGVLYTALTRARELLIVVGDDAAIRAMAANDRQQKRYSGLRWRLAHSGE